MASQPRGILRPIEKELLLDEQALQYRRPGWRGACYLVVGLDFGTSATKVVIQAPDLPGSPSYPVDFGSLAHSSSPFLLPTKLWPKDDKFSLSPQPKADPVSDIKTALFAELLDNSVENSRNRSTSRDRTDREAIAAIYLALALRYSRRWFLQTKVDLIRQYSRIVWSVNMGVPSPCIEDNEQNRAFRRVGKAAWLLSTLPENLITLAKARQELQRVEEPGYWDDDDDWTCDFEIIPEIAAGAVGYALSTLRRDGLHVMVDIGASTVDVCTFLLSSEETGDRYSLLIADVRQIGIARLHFERIAAIRQTCEQHTTRLRDTFEAIDPLPQDLRPYIIAESVLHQALEEAHDRVIDQVDLMLRGAIWKTKLRRHRKAPEWTRGKLPILVIGGGSHAESFMSVIRQLDAWLRKYVGNDGINILPVPVPASFKESSTRVTETEQRRLAVAWGLSHRALDVGEITPADQIPDEPPPPIRSWRDKYVGKEVV